MKSWYRDFIIYSMYVALQKMRHIAMLIQHHNTDRMEQLEQNTRKEKKKIKYRYSIDPYTA